MPYKHLSIEERELIQKLIWEKQSIRHIAQVLDRSPSSISREIQKNKPPIRKQYTPRLAHERAVASRSSRGAPKLEKDAELYEYVKYHLKLGWSPEQIALVCGDISHEAIYQYVYRQIYRAGHRPGRIRRIRLLVRRDRGRALRIRPGR